MSSLSTIVPGSHLRMRSLQLRLNSLLPDSSSVSWDESCCADLRWWSEESHLLVGLPLGLPHPELALYTDASDSGWGAFLADDQLSGLWSPEFSNFLINHQELLAVLYGVQGFLPVLRGRSVSLFADNTTALSYLRKQGGTHSSTLNTVAQTILPLCEDHRIQLVVQFVPGSPERSCRFSQSALAGLGIRMDPLSSGILGVASPLASNHRSVRDFLECSSPSVLRSGP